MNNGELEKLVQHPHYHSICLGFWHAVDARGLEYLRGLSPEGIADAISQRVQLPGDRPLRKLLVDACASWLREEHNFWGMVYQDEGGMVWSPDFTKASLLKDLPRESRPVSHNFPKLGILCLRSPLPSTVLLQEHEELCAAFVIGDTRSALGFDQTIVFRPDFSVELPGRLQDGRIVDRCVFGWPTVLAPEGGPQWTKLFPQAAIALDSIVVYVDEDQLLAQFDTPKR